MTTTYMTTSGTMWLLSALPYAAPQQDQALAEIPVGTLFDVLRTSNRFGDFAVQALTLNDTPVGPVLLNRGGTAEFLVPVGTAAWWANQLATMPGWQPLQGITMPLGAGTTLVCPWPGTRAEDCGWIVEPDGSGLLTDPLRLAAALLNVHERASRGPSTEAASASAESQPADYQSVQAFFATGRTTAGAEQ